MATILTEAGDFLWTRSTHTNVTSGVFLARVRVAKAFAAGVSSIQYKIDDEAATCKALRYKPVGSISARPIRDQVFIFGTRTTTKNGEPGTAEQADGWMVKGGPKVISPW